MKVQPEKLSGCSTEAKALSALAALRKKKKIMSEAPTVQTLPQDSGLRPLTVSAGYWL